MKTILAFMTLTLFTQISYAHGLPEKLVGSYRIEPSQCQTNYDNKYNKNIGVLSISYAEINHLDITLSKEGERDVLFMRDSGTEKALPLSGEGYEEKYYAKAKYTISEGSVDFQAKGKELSTCSVESNIGLSYPCIKKWNDRVALSLSEAGDLLIRWSIDGQKNGYCQLKRVR
ncbi:hypothetical protein [Bdellovibrio sp. BCCA]|uniref:hypothetical protein n=1 Tax=Bdellovibrio sp. BCCA TaxID=3136281 RepID=UPI0030F2E4D4